MKKIIINYNPWETRVAIIRNGKLENLFLGQATDTELERSFFKGKILKEIHEIAMELKFNDTFLSDRPICHFRNHQWKHLCRHRNLLEPRLPHHQSPQFYNG